jgi:hypothetical protein
MSGGFTVQAGTSCDVKLEGKDSSGKPISENWGPHQIGAGAVVDLDLSL